ncbi:transglycosylase family protein [Nocardioides marmoraquaticus]
MRKLVVSLLAALAVVLPALAITTPAQAATAVATSSASPEGTEPTEQEQAAAEKAAADKAAAAQQKAAKEKAAKKKAAAQKAAKARAAKKRAAKKRAAKRQAQVRVWNRLAHCESTSRWAVNTGNGYYGGLQISPGTWRAFGGQRFAGLPHRATKSEQITVGKRIKAGQGWGAWPSCSRRLGLR